MIIPGTSCEFSLRSACHMKTSNRSVLRRSSANMPREWSGLPVAVLCAFGVIFADAACWFNSELHDEGVEVSTTEPCLNCTCSRGTLLCYLRVCPQLPNPPPAGCILLHRYHTCCPELICTDSFEGSNGLEARSEPNEEFDLGDPKALVGNACVVNGSVYGPGSAMDSSTFCEYCYCLRGKQICVKPKCLLPVDGCVPMYEETNCCPVHYNCTYDTPSTSTTTVQTTQLELNQGGCMVDGVYYKEGGKVLGIGYSVCDNCYCLRGILRCEPLSCAPPLFGCTPVIRPGECCAASYNCSGTIEIQPEPNYGHYPIISKDYAKFRKEVHDKNSVTVPTIKNQRTHGSTRHFTGPAFSSSTVKPFFYNSITTQGSKILPKVDQNSLDDRLNRRVETIETTEMTSTVDTTTMTEVFSTETTETTESESTTEFTTTESFPITLKTVLNSTDCTNLNEKSDSFELVETTTLPTTTSVDLEKQETVIFTTKIHTQNTTPALDLALIYNITKSKDPDYEYDYSEPSLPPSLPNLRIIPFVAADALDLENEKHNVIHPQERVTDISHTYNLFSPPVETEGGFIPKQPPILDNLYDEIVTTTTTISPQLREITCILDEQEINHGESIVSETTCNTCGCFYGNIVCQKTICPIPKIDCQKFLLQDPTTCCPLFACDNELPTVVLDRMDSPETVTPDPFRDVIRTEPAPNLQSLIVDVLKRKTTTEKPFSLDKVLQLLFSTEEEVTTTTSTTTTSTTTQRLSTTEFDSNTVDSSTSNVGILKLAGCNIYGRMYRVGRIISELSNPCLECRCTETGVQCRPLKC
nr:PREDICTED: uncharacterized protein LOC662691 isoform X2 [Tribolium castaneum]|eukprot:XP_973867.3 PREDICTED: uncharacterized protein LOC662691 isoform X2 [Tribolium castaneum]